MAMSLIWPTWVGQRTIPINIAVRMHSVTLLCLLERCFPKSSEQFAVLAVGMHGVTLSCMLASGFFFPKNSVEFYGNVFNVAYMDRGTYQTNQERG